MALNSSIAGTQSGAVLKNATDNLTSARQSAQTRMKPGEQADAIPDDKSGDISNVFRKESAPSKAKSRLQRFFENLQNAANDPIYAEEYVC
ncbi:MAG: hypothetical protein ACRBDL_05820 [Alphaproteobacteria bacterium]